MKYRTTFIIIFALCVIIGTLMTLSRYYASPTQKEPYKITNSGDTLHIAYIGDSWAYMHHYHCQIVEILNDTLHQPTVVHSFGICGLTSKEIYENIFNNNDFKSFLQIRNYNYCFISAGINDCNKKMGIKNYKKSMKYIIQFMLYNHIRPIILEIPDYDIKKSFQDQSPSRKLIRRISMWITNTPMDCKQQFRDALNELIIENEYQDKVSIIRYQTWNNNYYDDLNKLYLNDGLHLNEQGYDKLDSAIAKEILSSMTIRK